MLKQFFSIITISTVLVACTTIMPSISIEPINTIGVDTETNMMAASAVDAVIASEPAAVSLPESLPYPKLDQQEQIDKLTIQINRVNEKIEQINKHIHQLEQHYAMIARSAKSQSKIKPKKQVVLPIQSSQQNEIKDEKEINEIQAAQISTLEQARKLYEQGNYQSVLAQLRGDDGGGDGSYEAQQKMWLLLKSNKKLHKCQSVIYIGQRFVSRFGSHEYAPEALFLVGQCQWSIQQQDIARDTWRDLIRRYPNSSFVVKATKAIKRPK